MNLREIRHASGVPSSEIARRMGLRYTRSLLRVEKSDAHNVRTLADMARAFNARLSITFTMSDGTVCPYDLPAPQRQEEAMPRLVYPQRFVAIRRRKGLLLKDVAELAKLNYGNLSELENGKITPTWPTLVSIGRVLGIKDRSRIEALVAAEVGRQNLDEAIPILREALSRFERRTVDSLVLEPHVRGVDRWLERRAGMSDINLDRLRRFKVIMDEFPAVTDEWLQTANPALPGAAAPIAVLKQHKDGARLVARLLNGV